MLTVYKASAGSGKTFRLAVEYIKRLIMSANNYESILAVTFTNKATEEMKMRILSQLYGIANALPDSDGYLNVMLPELVKINETEKFTEEVVNEAFVRHAAQKALHMLLHNYNFFRIETIDRFFQTILRNLARELELSPNLRVEIADEEVVNRAVDRWIDSLHDGDNELNWIIDYVHSTMDDEKSWNIISSIKSFALNLLKDDYKEVSDKLEETLQSANSTFFTDYIKELRRLASDAVKEISADGAALWKLVTDHGMDETSFMYTKNGIGGFMKNLATKDLCEVTIGARARSAADTTDSEAKAWMKKTASAEDKAFCIDTLRPALNNILEKLPRLQKQARSARVTLSNLSSLRLLRAIQKEITEYNREQESFLLSDTQDLLRRMIEGSDTPFIFEKIGAQLKNIMIDEFQDTSRIQWQNFKVLLDDSLSNNNENLIVGDVKQSIYRWRSGDWRLLNNIEDEYKDQVHPEHLQTNRRSATRVIKFNNAFFKTAIPKIVEQLDNCSESDRQMLDSAYSDVAQEYPEGKKEAGFVNVRFFEKGSDYKQETMQYVADTIIELCTRGVEPNDIAILARTNDQITEIANHCLAQFAQHEDERIRALNIVSDEAYRLDASPAVCLIIDALRYITQPEDLTIKALLKVRYHRYVEKSEAEQSELLFNRKLPQAFLDNVPRLANMPLYQLCEELYSIFRISEMAGQSAFVCCFFDGLNDFMQRAIGDIPSFLTYWDEKMHKKKVESDSDNGVRILSIHKSKGLEFQTVIVPFCDWEHDKYGSLLWCTPDVEPYKRLPAIPMNSKKLADTIYEDEYWEEKLQNEVDNINVLYVALTRAVDNLYITTQSKQNVGYRGHIIENSMADVAKELGFTITDPTNICYGEVVVEEKKGTERTSNVFLQPSATLTVIPTNSVTQPEFRESNVSKDFTLTDEQEDEQQRSQYIKLGNVLHYVFSKIRTIDDVDSALLEMEMDGLLYGQDITSDALRERILHSMEKPEVARWFSPHWKLYNECTILTTDADGNVHEHRPDRVMTDGNETIVVDFKLFSLHDEYFDQVRRYMDLLHQMGHKNVHGYLWQVISGKVTEVKSE